MTYNNATNGSEHQWAYNYQVKLKDGYFFRSQLSPSSQSVSNDIKTITTNVLPILAKQQLYNQHTGHRIVP